MASLVWEVGSRVRCLRRAPGSDVLEMGVQGAYCDGAVQEERWPGGEKPGLKGYSGGATGQKV